MTFVVAERQWGLRIMRARRRYGWQAAEWPEVAVFQLVELSPV